jgi:hypothetical protein
MTRGDEEPIPHWKLNDDEAVRWVKHQNTPRLADIVQNVPQNMDNLQKAAARELARRTLTHYTPTARDN